MELFYKFVLLVHLTSAMLFIGWGFAKLFAVGPVKNSIGENAYANLQKALSKRVWRIYPPNMLVLISTGTILFFKYATFENGIFPTTFQTLLIVKALLAYGIGVKVVYSISQRIIFKVKNSKDPNPVESSAYYYIMAMGFIIVMLAKIMFMV